MKTFSALALASLLLCCPLSTSFNNKQSASETLTLIQEADGSWRSAGYYIR